MNVQTSGLADRVRHFYPTVSRFPLAGPDGLRTPWYGLFRMDTNQPVGGGSVSGRYVPHTTDDVVALVEAAESVMGEVDNVQMGWRDGHFLSIEPQLTHERRLEMYENDIVFPRLFIHAPYGGAGCFVGSVALSRIVCSNLYTMKTVAGVNVRIRHTSGLREKMDDLIADFSSLSGGWEALAARVKQMNEVKVKVADFLNEVYGQPDEGSERSIKLHRNRTESIIRRLARERMKIHGDAGDLHTATAWEAFNAVQGFVQHDKSRKGLYVNEFDRVILANEDATVARAERLSLEMAV
jgi:hypothetical protein